MSAPAALHEPQKVAQASCLFGADRLEACPTLQPAARFMAPTHVQFLEVFPLHEPPLSRPSATLSPPCGERAGRGVPIWFMVPMHGWKTVGTSLEPSLPHPILLPQWGRRCPEGG